MSRKNIKISEEAFEEHNARRQALDLGWEEYIDAQHPLMTEAEFREVLREEIERAVSGT